MRFFRTPQYFAGSVSGNSGRALLIAEEPKMSTERLSDTVIEEKDGQNLQMNA